MQKTNLLTKKLSQFQKRVQVINTDILIKAKQSGLDLIAYLSLISQKPSLQEALDFQKEATAGEPQEQYSKILEDIIKEIDFFYKVESSIWGYG